MKMLNRNEKWTGLERWGLIEGFFVQAPGCMTEEDELQSSGWLSQGHPAGHGRAWVSSLSAFASAVGASPARAPPSTAAKDLYDAMSPVPYAVVGAV